MSETSTKPAVRLTSISPVFVVPDVVASAEYYGGVLGFRILSYFLDPPVFVMVARDTAAIHFGRADDCAPPLPNVARRGISVCAYIWVNDLDALYAEFQGRGAKILGGRVRSTLLC